MLFRKAKTPPIPSHIPHERVFEFDIYADSASGGDVQKTHMQLHSKAPDIFFTPHNGGHWIATRFADVQKIMTTPELFSSREAFFSPDIGRVKISLPPQDMDAPEHMRYRSLLMKFMSPREIVKREEQIRELTNQLIDNVIHSGHCEFVADVSVPLPVKTFMGMMHMDLARYSQFVTWANGILGSETLWQRLPHFVRMTIYLKSLIRQRKKKPGADPISLLLASEIEGVKLTDKQVLNMCNLLFLAGLDTVTNAMTFITQYLAKNPAQQQRLRDNPETIPAAIEELMRRHSFVNVPRRVTQDTELNGAQLRKDEIIISSFAAASNDDRRIEQPEQVNFDRTKSPHLAFNTGPHNCAGATLARLELKVFLETWLSRVPPFRLADNYRAIARGGPVMALEKLDLCWDNK